MKIYTTTVVEEGEDLVFNVPDQILENLHLDVGDTVEYVVHDDYIVMKKVNRGLDALIVDSAETKPNVEDSNSE